MSTRVAVIGGGLAGVTAALRCADAGCEVTLLEARRELGGLTRSFRRGDLLVDNGQHVFLRCCTSYRALLSRLGVADGVVLQPRLSIPVHSPRTARPALLRRSRFPAPLHLAGSLLRYRRLSIPERVRAARAATALRGVDATDPATDRHSFGSWLRRHGQSEQAVAALWDLVGVATLNAPAERASLGLAATVFQQGLLTEAAAADIGWARVPLRHLHSAPARVTLRAAGAQVRTGATVRRLEHRRTGWRVLTRSRADPGDDGEETVADRVVLAVPPAEAQRLLPPDSVDLPSGWAERLGSSPIVNAHVVLDRRVLDEPFVAGVGTPVQWVFDRTGPSGPSGPGHGQYLALSLSAADGLIDTPAPRLRERLLPELSALLPQVRTARVRDFFVTRERHATFRPAPGTAALRPPAVTRAPGVYLAGAWTATGWPATMEGAVRSGETAASALLVQLSATGSTGSTGVPGVPGVPDLHREGAAT